MIVWARVGGDLTQHECVITDGHSDFGAVLNQGTLTLASGTEVTDNVVTGSFGGGLCNLMGGAWLNIYREGARDPVCPGVC